MKDQVILNFDLYKKYKSDYAPDSFHHVAFKTQNYDAMVEFYEKLLVVSQCIKVMILLF